MSSPNRPHRNRKRNRLIFHDEDTLLEDSVMSQKSKAKPQPMVLNLSGSPILKSSLTKYQNATVPGSNNDISSGASQMNAEKTAAKRVGSRLRNLLKLPKAHKMCVFEWFYSNLDNALFNEDNDFCMCLKESFPELKTVMLTRAHWSKIRRLMGKPRRCSEAFFHEERVALANKRNKIRLLQQNKIPPEDQDTWCLPREIPMPLVVGTKVTAWLRGTHDGLFTGQIDAVDVANASYRVTFDRSNLGTHLVPDTEVSSFEPQETINLMALLEQKANVALQRFSAPPVCHSDADTSLASHHNEHDPVLGRSPLRSKLQISSVDEVGGTLGGFPVQLLKKVARLSRILSLKKEKIQKLADMNSDAEKANSYGESLNLEFQRKYATIVLDLERLNKDLNEMLIGVQRFCLELYPEQTLPNDETSSLRRRCFALAEQMVASKNMSNNGPKSAVRSTNLTDLVTQLTSLMMQVKALSECSGTSIEFKSLNDTTKDIKAKLNPENATCFQNNVEIHIAHIKSGMEHDKYLNLVNVAGGSDS